MYIPPLSQNIANLPQSDHIHLPDDETSKLMIDYVPASLHSFNLSHTLNNGIILDHISGRVRPCKMLDVVGASGARKLSWASSRAMPL